MRRLLSIFQRGTIPVFITVLLTLLSGCTSTSPEEPVPEEPVYEVVISQPVKLGWGGSSAESLNFQHPGLSGNLAAFTGSSSPALSVLVLGEPRPPGERVVVDILGVLEQVKGGELSYTVITSTGDYSNLMDIEESVSGALMMLETGLIKLQSPDSRSLGFRSADYAKRLVQRLAG